MFMLETIQRQLMNIYYLKIEQKYTKSIIYNALYGTL